MKKVNLTNTLNVLDRKQMKEILGGVAEDNDKACADRYINVEPDCRAKYPAPATGETMTSAFMYVTCIADGYHKLGQEGCTESTIKP